MEKELLNLLTGRYRSTADDTNFEKSRFSVNTVNKLNESYEAVTVTPEGSNIGVNIGIDKFYDAMENGRSYDEVVDKAVEVVNSGITQRPDFDIDSL